MAKNNNFFLSTNKASKLPVGADNLKEITKDITPAGVEKASVAVFILTILFGILFLIAPFLLLFLETNNSYNFPFDLLNNFTFILLFSFILAFACIAIEIRQAILIRRNKIIALIKPYTEQLLVNDEKLIAICSAIKTGTSLWLTGISKQGVYVFSSHRLFLITFNSVAKSFKKALESPEDNIKVMVCDIGTKGKFSVGGFMFPPLMHLIARKISIIPEGAD